MHINIKLLQMKQNNKFIQKENDEVQTEMQ